MLTDDYRVQLEAFEGPLDLLLYLVRKNEVEIENIPVATITEQYLKFLEGLERIDIEVAGEFLVMAASLMELKSRMMMPVPVGLATESGPSESRTPTEDPRADLVRQLLAYKRFRDAAEVLEHRAEEWSKRFPAAKTALPEDSMREAIERVTGEIEVEDLDLLDLVEAFKRISETVNFDRLGDHPVKYDDTPVELYAEDILDRMRREAPTLEALEPRREMELVTIFRGRTRGQMVGLFLALLHLVRKRQVAVRQERGSGSIYLMLREPEDEGTEAGNQPSQPN